MNALIDGASIHTRAELHDSLEEQLSLPDWYGRNLDALFDCLTDLSEETVVRLIHPQALEEHLGGYAGVLQNVLRDAAEDNPRFRFELVEDDA